MTAPFEAGYWLRAAGDIPSARPSRMRHFHALSAEAMVQAIRSMADEGYGLATMAQAAGVSVEQIRRVLEGTGA